MHPMDYRPDIDGLRALAVGSVVLFHLGVPGFSGGFVGVDVFFVISGFLITRILVNEVQDGRFSFARFYTRRARRLFPALFVTLSTSLVFGVLLLSAEHLERMGMALASALAFRLQLLVRRRERVLRRAGRLQTPAAHLVAQRRGAVLPRLADAAARAVALEETLARAAGSRAARVREPRPRRGVASHRRGCRVLSGSVPGQRVRGRCADGMGRSVRAPRRAIWLEVCVAVGLVAVLVPVVSYSDETVFPGLTTFPVTLGSALLIYGGRARYLGRLLDNPPAVALGLISYSLYLVHWPLIVFYEYWKFAPLDGGERVVVGGASVVLAAGMYRFVEQPFRRKQGLPGGLTPGRYGLACLGLSVALAVARSARVGEGRMGLAHRQPGRRVGRGPDRRSQPRHGRVRETRKCALPAAAGSAARPRAGSTTSPLLGDSHAEQWIHGLHALFEEQGRRAILLTTGGGAVPFEGGVTWYGAERRRPAVENAYRKLRALDVKTVVFAARWHLYANTTAGDVDRHWFEYGEHRGSEPASSSDALEQAARDAIGKLLGASKHVVVIGQVPPYGVSALHCFRRPGWLIDFSDPATCRGYDARRVREIAAVSDGIFEALSRELGFTYVNLTEQLCSSDESGEPSCAHLLDGQFIYRDDDHVNRFGSATLMRALGGAFD